MAGVVQGIQHLGIGVSNHEASWKWYRKFFGMNIPLFNAEANAPLMMIYTKGENINKRAAMVVNLKGGAAMEIVQPTSFEPTQADQKFELGDLGIFIGKYKTPDLKVALEFFKSNGQKIISEGVKTPHGKETFFVLDPDGLILQVLESDEWYTGYNHPLGGNTGCTIACSDIDAARKLYSDILCYDKPIYDKKGVFEDWKDLPGGNREFRRVLLGRSKPNKGGFNKLSGTTHIELVQDLTDRKKTKMYEGRMWGDIGFVHLGFDVRNMTDLGEKLNEAGFGFTCDTKDVLSMGDSTRVHCTYIEDPDGTLIELIEVYKIPILEKLGIYLNVEKRDPDKPLPDAMLKSLKFMRKKD
jgi:catechol 2,3-dioxygenase-like lactoylglutathione lyase family enzyme